MVKKALPWVVALLVLSFIIRNPHGAAMTGHRIGSGLVAAASAVGDFFTALAGGP